MLHGKRLRIWSGLLILAGLAVIMLATDLQMARFDHTVEARQGISTGRAGEAAPAAGERLSVFVAGEGSLATAVAEPLRAALQEREIPFTELQFLLEIPDEVSEPFLLIRIDNEDTFWTPLYGSGQISATLFYWQGMVVTRETVERRLTAGPAEPMILSDGAWVVRGEREVKLNQRARGLMSRSAFLRGQAEQLGREAATLILEAVPQFNPAKWGERAIELAKKEWNFTEAPWGSFMSVEGCRGGVGRLYRRNQSEPWVFYYYDASVDRITWMLHSDQVMPQLRGLHDLKIADSSRIGASRDGISLWIGRRSDGSDLTLHVPMVQCQPGDWEVR